MRHICAPVAGVTTALSALVLTLLFLASAAEARTALVELRVEGAQKTLDPGTWYVTGSERVRRGNGHECKPRPGMNLFRGPTALGLLGSAQDANRRLLPVRVRSTDFGPQVCQVGSIRSFGTFPGDSGGLLFWHDYASGSSSPDLAKLRNGDRVLWHYAEFGSSPVNTGNPLRLRRVPARDADGKFVVRVFVHDFDGSPTPVDDATIRGAQSVTPLGSNGRYEVTVGRGNSTLRATRGLDIASNRVRTCVKPKLSRCPSAHGRTIVGSPRGDRLPGTKGWDRINAGRGNDRINLRKGGRDRVRCGGGRDLVLLRKGDRDDRIARNCERIRRS